MLFLALIAPCSPAATDTDQIAALGGSINITPITHGSVQVEFGNKVIQIDPWSRGNYSAAKKADLILVTDIHSDHFDPVAISNIKKDDTAIIVPSAAADRVEGGIVLSNGETREVSGIYVAAIPMYNNHRGPKKGQLYHDKGRGNGYILTLGGKLLYFSGDTACIPEIKMLQNIDVAFVTMNLPYTMPPEEAAECVRAFEPKIVYPYHYRGSDLNIFANALKDKPNIEVRIREWYSESSN